MSFKVAKAILLTDHFGGRESGNQFWRAAGREEGRRLGVREEISVGKEPKK